MTSPPDVYVDPNGKNMRRWPFLMTNRRMAVRLEKFFDKPGLWVLPHGSKKGTA